MDFPLIAILLTNVDILETIDYLKKRLLFYLTQVLEWDTMNISTTDKTTL